MCIDLVLIFLLTVMAKRFTEFGGTIPKRPVEDLAFGVTRFIQKGGSYINYYMVKCPTTNIMIKSVFFLFRCLMCVVVNVTVPWRNKLWTHSRRSIYHH